MDKTAQQMIAHYKNLQDMFPNSSMVMEAQEQYVNMAAGGDGGPGSLNGISVRASHYKNKPDSFFKEVATELGWI